MSLWIVYLIAAAVLMIIELLTGFVATFCVAVGCVIAAVLDFMGLGIEAQLIGLAAGVIVGAPVRVTGYDSIILTVKPVI